VREGCDCQLCCRRFILVFLIYFILILTNPIWLPDLVPVPVPVLPLSMMGVRFSCVIGEFRSVSSTFRGLFVLVSF